MASPTSFIEQNSVHTDQLGATFPVWIKESTLGEEAVTDVTSAWQLNEKELEAFSDTKTVFVSIFNCQPPIEVLWASPVPFEGQNKVYGHKDCLDLPVHERRIGATSFSVTSAWQLSPAGIEEVQKNGGIVFLRVVGAMPLLAVKGISPIR